jgi:ATP-dependent Lon protease
MNDTSPGRGYDAYPLLPLKNVVIFPHTIVTLMVGRPRSLRALEHALASNKRLVVMTQRNTSSEEPIPDDLYAVGTLVEVTSYLRQPDGNYQVMVEGMSRIHAVRYIATDWLYDVEVDEIVEPGSQGATTEALMRHVLGLFTDFGRLNQQVPADVLAAAGRISNPGQLADVVAAYVVSEAEQRQQLLALADQTERLEQTGEVVAGELDVLQIDEHIRSKVRSQIDKNQREFYLREQLKANNDELSGEGGNEIAELRQKVKARNLPEEVTARLLEELSRLERMIAAAPEANVARSYIDWLLSLPWSEQTEDCNDIRVAEEALNADHYGLEQIKERIIEFLAVRHLVARGGGHKTMAQVLCFSGPPGVGKTSLGQSIARAMNRNFVRIPLGGVHDEAELRGHRRTYVGAMPGRIIQGIKQGGSRNPVMLLDEVDKMTSDQRGDPASALLEALDPAQNNSFVDHYIDLPFDLSQTLFITTANYLGNIPRPLRDRLEIIELSGYSEDEKLLIARRYLLNRQLEGHGLERGYIEIPDKVFRAIIRQYTREAGVRELERKLAAICRKAVRQLVVGRNMRVRVTLNNIETYLGPARYNADSSLSKLNQIGVVTGLAWTEVGGEALPVELAQPADREITSRGEEAPQVEPGLLIELPPSLLDQPAC